MRTTAFALSITLLAISHSAAGEFNSVLSIGDKAPTWTDLPGVDGKTHALDDLKNQDVVVVAFTCNSCPYAVDYENRLIDFAKRHAGKKVALVAINVNTIEEDRLPKMQERAKAKGFNFPYLFDESQAIGKAYGAAFTPEFFVLDKERRVVYMGAMDDNTDPEKVNQRWVETAVAAALAGHKPEKTETIAVGCRVRYETRRRKKN